MALTPLHLDPKRRSELALLNLEIYNSTPNIDRTNNKFAYSPSNGTSRKTIVLRDGSYAIAQINDEISLQLEKQN